MSARDVIADDFRRYVLPAGYDPAKDTDWHHVPAEQCADRILGALSAAGIGTYDTRTHAAVPREPSLEALQDGREAYARTQVAGVSGMTIDAQIRAECARVKAAWDAMLAAAEAEAREAGDE